MGITRFAEATWKGDLMSGSGTIDYVSSGAFTRMPVTWASRTEDHNGRTSPEELIAAAHAACFSMAFSARAWPRTAHPPPSWTSRPSSRSTRRRRLEDRPQPDHGPGRRPGHRRGDLRLARRRRQGQLPVSQALKGNVELAVDATLA